MRYIMSMVLYDSLSGALLRRWTDKALVEEELEATEAELNATKK
jgi:hypothetical protein